MTHVERVCDIFGEKPPNMNHETGIHYGVIPLHQLTEWAHETFDQGRDLGYERALNEFKSQCLTAARNIIDDAEEMADRKAIKKNLGEELAGAFDDCREALVDGVTVEELAEVIQNACQDSWNDGMAYGESGPYRIEEDGLTAELHSDGDCWVFDSPFYTICGECSPCAPNAGYLTDNGDSVKAYCFGLDWFDDGPPLPYKVFRVRDDFELTSMPDAVIKALRRRFNDADFNIIMDRIQFSHMGCYGFQLKDGGMFYGVEPDGYIHT